ncbi:type VI secretion system-associated protein TagF [Paraburkholderia aspalathi]|uniref:type VI secretion system-associated protein TagF n=1 Tax=Paraburkholderia aspalathi TaxID=1324617 RepID=UPI0038BB8F4C
MNLCRPALWGKLPAFGDFVRVRVTPAQARVWELWCQRLPFFARAQSEDFPVHGIPWSFVFAPGCLSFSGRNHVIGVIADSCDRVGRRHPFVLSYVVSWRWLSSYPEHSQNVLFRLARVLALHTPPLTDQRGGGDPLGLSLETRLMQEFGAQRPGRWSRWIGRPRIVEAAEGEMSISPPMLESDPAWALRGVPDVPWANWPACTAQQGTAWFWQQDCWGRYVGAHRVFAPI